MRGGGDTDFFVVAISALGRLGSGESVDIFKRLRETS